MTNLNLPHGLRFEDLYDEAGLLRLDRLFVTSLAEHAPDLAGQLKAGREAPDTLDAKSESALLIALAPQHEQLTPLYTCKRLFVQRQALRAHKPQEVADLDAAPIEAELERRIGAPLTDLAY